jgi:hypothetical protein
MTGYLDVSCTSNGVLECLYRAIAKCGRDVVGTAIDLHGVLPASLHFRESSSDLYRDHIKSLAQYQDNDGIAMYCKQPAPATSS